MYDTPGLLLRRVQAELRAERHVDPAHEAPHRHQALHLQGVRPGEAGRGHRLIAANRLIGEVVQSRRRPLLGPSPGWRLLALSH